MQNQQRIEWPRKLVVAKAYIDQLERSQALPADQIAALRQAIQSAESSRLNRSGGGKTQKPRAVGGKERWQTKSSADSSRLQALAEILRRPAL